MAGVSQPCQDYPWRDSTSQWGWHSSSRRDTPMTGGTIKPLGNKGREIIHNFKSVLKAPKIASTGHPKRAHRLPCQLKAIVMVMDIESTTIRNHQSSQYWSFSSTQTVKSYFPSSIKFHHFLPPFPLLLLLLNWILVPGYKLLKSLIKKGQLYSFL